MKTTPFHLGDRLHQVRDALKVAEFRRTSEQHDVLADDPAWPDFLADCADGKILMFSHPDDDDLLREFARYKAKPKASE